MKTKNNITNLIGNTQLVKLNHLVDDEYSASVYLKIEASNPSGSVKDRIGLAMINAAEISGELKPGETIIEATSGNTGIALAMIAAARNYHCILTMPESMSIERRKLLTLYGAEIVLTPAEEGMNGAIAKAKILSEQTKNSFMPQQFENPANPDIHRTTTAEEIWAATEGNIDAFVCGVGTGGTISGVADVIKKRKSDFKVIAVEPKESPVISGGQPGQHKIQGIGAGFIPKNLQQNLLDSIELVSTNEAFMMRRRLAAEEGIFAGISTGASVCAALRIAKTLGLGKTVVTMMHDTGERYLSMDQGIDAYKTHIIQ